MSEDKEEDHNNDEPNYQLRFSDIVDLDRLGELRILIIGAGGIGAPSALSLAKMGVKTLTIYDFDEVSNENIGPQMYGPADVGRPKVEVLKEFLGKQAPWTKVLAYNDRFVGQPIDCDIMIAAVDSLQVRNELWRRVLQTSEKPELYIDPRMGAEVLTIFSVIPGKDDRWYRKTLEGEAMEAVCTAKSTFYTGFTAGAFVSQVVKAHVADERTTAEFNFDMRYLQMFSADVDQKQEAA